MRQVTLQNDFGGFGGRLVTVGILISVYGTINGYTLTGMRLLMLLQKKTTCLLASSLLNFMIKLKFL